MDPRHEGTCGHVLPTWCGAWWRSAQPQSSTQWAQPRQPAQNYTPGRRPYHILPSPPPLYGMWEPHVIRKSPRCGALRRPPVTWIPTEDGNQSRPQPGDHIRHQPVTLPLRYRALRLSVRTRVLPYHFIRLHSFRVVSYGLSRYAAEPIRLYAS